MTYYLRNIPPDLWDAFRERARTRGVSARTLLVALMRAHVAGRAHARIDAADKTAPTGPAPRHSDSV